MIREYRFILLLIILVLTASADAGDDFSHDSILTAAVSLASSECSSTFITHTLPHVTTVNDVVIRMFESNGAGLAINDLNGDGLHEIVLANLDGDSTILWNEGDLNFRAQPLDVGAPTRAVTIVDVDGDSWQDIVFTTQLGAPLYWHNHGDETFTLAYFSGVAEPAYTLAWGDLDSDGDLDLVTGSYDTELEMLLRDSFLFSDGAGVFYYENDGGEFIATRLAERANALAVFLTDLNGDGAIDIAIGNDFGLEDQYFTRENDAWVEFFPFSTMTHSTMSFDAGDVNNDGTEEFFATDMLPYSDDAAVVDAWAPLLYRLGRVPEREGNPQIMENVLQLRDENGEYANVARTYGVYASGWSWSGKFGDLDHDGYLDLYVVNGMIEFDLFRHLPNSELVEENQAFRNVNGAGFAAAPEWGLGSTASGRGMSMADLDNDGDLEIVVNNLMSPAQLFENQLCGGSSLIVDLRRADTANPFAVGARVVLHTSSGIYTRELRSISGYLSGDPASLHFGFPFGSTLDYLEVDWGDGVLSRIDSPQPNTRLTIARTE